MPRTRPITDEQIPAHVECLREGGFARSFVAIALVAAVLAAQPARAEPVRLSIADAMKLAGATSEQVEIARAGLRRAEAEQLRARSELFPQLAGSASYERTLQSEFDALRGNGGNGGNGFQDLPFGRDHTWRLGLSLAQNVYTGGRITARRELASAGEQSARAGVESARAQAVLDAASAYYDAVLTQQLVAIAEALLSWTEQTLATAQVGRETGNVPEFDLLRARVTVDTQRATLVQRRSERTLALWRLKQLLEIAPETELELTTTLDAGPGDAAEVAHVAREQANVSAGPAAVRVPVLQARQAVRIGEASSDVARSQRLPQVSITSQLGRVAYPEDLFPTYDDFRSNWVVGLGLQVPIFTGGRIRGDVLAAEADLDDARARLKLTEELARLDVQAASEQLEAARAAWQATAGTVEQARRAHEIAEIRYREGVSTQLELSDARLLLEQAQATRARAARDLHVAQVKVALLPALPISSTVPIAAGATQVPSSTSGAAASPAAPSSPGGTSSTGPASQGFP